MHPLCRASLSVQSSARRTAVHTACAWAAPVAARRAGRAQPATSGPATPAAPSTAPVRMASVNVARDGTESTVPLVGCLCFTLSSLQNSRCQRCWPPLNKERVALKSVSSKGIFACVSL